MTPSGAAVFFLLLSAAFLLKTNARSNTPMYKAMKTIRLIFVVFLISFQAEAVQYKAGDRVWIAMYADNLKDDGYASGRVKAVNADGTVAVDITEVVVGKGRTLYGSCHPNGDTALSGAEIISPEKDNVHLEKTFEPAMLKPYREGSFEFIERENLSTVIQRWLSGNFGITSDMLRNDAGKARKMGVPSIALSLEMMANIEDMRGAGRGYPLPLEQRLEHADRVLEKTFCQLKQDPVAYRSFLEAYSARSPQKTGSLPAMVATRMMLDIRGDMMELKARFPDYAVAKEKTEMLFNVHPNFIRFLTNNGQQNYKNRSLISWLEQGEGGWPYFP